MASDEIQIWLQRIPSITELLKREQAEGWLKLYPPQVVTASLRRAVAEVRKAIFDRRFQASSDAEFLQWVLERAGALLKEAVTPRVRAAINATGIILHTGLGRAVLAESVIDSMVSDLKEYTVIAIDRESGERIERDELVEDLLVELTGAEAATVVNNNAAATLLVLAGLAAQKEVIVSRGQLIEIGGSFRLPEVMAQSGARLVEVGATNRTHLKDFRAAITTETVALMRAHPSNYRIVGFTKEVELRAMAELAHSRGLIVIDDLGAGALVDLAEFGLPHEPTVLESMSEGADVVLFSGDKLIGAGQAGIIVGRKPLIDRLRNHPLMRAVRVDKTCLMLLERTLPMFRDPDRLRREHPLYRMISTPHATLKERAERLCDALAHLAPTVDAAVVAGAAYVGSGSLPAEAIPSVVISVSVSGKTATELARLLRLDDACVFSRIEDDRVRLDMRTITDAQVPLIAAALRRAVSHPQTSHPVEKLS
ncbi:MAG: L-seryl-tRNA(Sec) selenium transferase [Verrucomicrobiia bacterium]